MTRTRMNAIAAVVAPCLVLGSLTSAVQAANICRGTVSGSPLRPIANPPVVSLEHAIDSSANPALAEQFVAGLQAAGVSVVPKGQGSTTLDLSFMLRGTHGGPKSGSYRDLTWMRGETVSGTVKAALQGARIDVTIYARDAATRSLVWTGAINCTIQTDDANALAEGLGAATGRALGRSVPKLPL